MGRFLTAWAMVAAFALFGWLTDSSGAEGIALFIGILLLIATVRNHRSKPVGQADAKAAARREQAIALLAEVTRGFRRVAAQRGEILSDSQLVAIHLFFTHQQRKFGVRFTRDHLAYELEKYRREGLRAEYAGASAEITTQLSLLGP